MPLHEFSRLKLSAKINPAGSISLSFQPLDRENARLYKSYQDSSMSLHFDNTCENGVNELSVYVSSNDSGSELTHRNAYFPIGMSF